MYIITKDGIYQHGVVFITDNKEQAIDRARACAEKDIDGYHQWTVRKYTEIPLEKIKDLYDAEHEETFSINKDEIKSK